MRENPPTHYNPPSADNRHTVSVKESLVDSLKCVVKLAAKTLRQPAKRLSSTCLLAPDT